VSKMVDNVSNASLSIRHEGRHMNISSQTAYQSNYRYYEEPIDGDFSAKDIVSIVNNYGKPWNKVKTWTQELRISSLEESSQRVSWMAGAFGFLTDDPVKQGSYFGEDAEIYGAEPNTTILTINEGKQRGVAVFGQANIRSEERRVGKECRSRSYRYHQKKKTLNDNTNQRHHRRTTHK